MKAMEAVRPEIQLSTLTPDVIQIMDEDLIEMLDDLIVDKEDSPIGPHLPLHLLHRARPILNSYKWTNRPDWLDLALDDAEWGHREQRRGNNVAWKAGEVIVVSAKFAITLSDNLCKVPADIAQYSSGMKGWVLAGMDLENCNELQDIFNQYDILPSPGVQAVLEGRDRWVDILDGHVQGAVDKNLRTPSIYPTDRTLEDHQDKAVLALAGMKRAILADQVGLGKSGEFICGYLSLAQDDAIEHGRDADQTWPIAVITNKSLKEEIAEEIVKWKGDAKVEVLYGQAPSDIPRGTEFIVLNVDLISPRLNDILAANPKGMITDEAHTLKNPSAKRTQAAQELSDYIWTNYGDDGYIVLASGTPFLNRPEELWSLLNITHVEEAFGDYALSKVGEFHKIATRSGWKTVKISARHAFEMRWCNGHYDDYKKWQSDGSSNEAELNGLLLKNVMIRRRKSDVMHPLPELKESIIEIEMTEEGREDYDRIQDEFREWMKEAAIAEADELGISPAEALKIVVHKMQNAEQVMRMTKLRKAVAAAKIDGIKKWIHEFMAGSIEEFDEHGEKVRVELDESRKKLIVFAYHRDIQRLLRDDEELQQYGLVSILGGEDAQEAKTLFQKDDGCRLIICYSGAREGHTLTAAKDVLIAEIPFLHTWIVQMAGRCWARLSEDFKPHEATIHYAVSPNSIDSLLLRKIRMKRAKFNAIIDGEGIEDLAEVDQAENDDDLMMSLLARGKRAFKIAA